MFIYQYYNTLYTEAGFLSYKIKKISRNSFEQTNLSWFLAPAVLYINKVNLAESVGHRLPKGVSGTPLQHRQILGTKILKFFLLKY